MQQLHRPAGSAGDGPDPLHITPEGAGWIHAGLRVIDLAPGAERTLATDQFEVIVLPLSGSVRVEIESATFDLAGRTSVWSGVSDFAYAPLDTEVRLSTVTGGQFALPMAVADGRREPGYQAADDIAIEVRGAGQATRQITNFCSPDAYDADTLMAVEVYTPAGNWSSYPPHKHDGRSGGPSGCEEAVLEEIYYFRILGDDGFGLHRTYAADGSFDQTVTVRDGDAFLVPHGYHGPCVAPPGYPVYYLNVLAGPGAQRSMAFCTDPAHEWLWAAWRDEPQDPRCPMVTTERGVTPPPRTGRAHGAA